MMGKTCVWTRTPVGHFNISCDNTGKRANGNFKSDANFSAAWEFVYCPYCGGVIQFPIDQQESTDEAKK